MAQIDNPNHAAAALERAPAPGRDSERAVAGITDPEWLDWFAGGIDHCFDPWNEWLKYQRFPRANPPIAQLEHDIEDLVKAADILRQSTVPQTKTFKARYGRFRKQHEELDCRGKYCRLRYMVWRAAALKVICERDRRR